MFNPHKTLWSRHFGPQFTDEWAEVYSCSLVWPGSYLAGHSRADFAFCSAWWQNLYFTFPNAARNTHFVMPTFPHAQVKSKIAIEKNHSLPLHKRNASRVWDYTTETDLHIAFPSRLISELATCGSSLSLRCFFMLLSYFRVSLRSVALLILKVSVAHYVPIFFFFCIKSISREWRPDFVSPNPGQGPSFHPLGQAALRTSSARHSTGLRRDCVRQGSPLSLELYNLICQVKSKNWKPKLKIIK